MKSVVYIFLIIGILPNAYSQWEKVEGLPGMTDMYFISDSVGWFSSSTMIYKTTNKGRNWDSIIPPPFITITTVYFYSDSIGWINDLYFSRPSYTTDGGKNWIASNPNFLQSGYGSHLELGKIRFVNRYEGWGVGQQIYKNSRNDCYCNIRGVVIKTLDGGKTWTVFFQSFAIYDMFLKNNNVGWVVGSPARINKVDSSGITNHFLFGNELSSSIRSIQFYQDSIGIAVGTNGSSLLFLFKSINSGISWEVDTLPMNAICNDAYFCSVDTGWIATSQGIYRTINAGVSWIKQSNFVAKKLFFTLKKEGWAINSQEVYKATSENVSLIKDTKNAGIQTFNLAQNYPNPFNPSTVINYYIPIGCFVSLKIYDILGIEVSSLVNQKQEAGTYDITFAASHLPSGVYFYRLQTDLYMETKKLLLLK